jgi:tRNA threonylcarbamoyladenosine biosynthesis protein TsaB
MLLAIETAGYACSVALIAGDQLIAERHALLRRGHAERLVPMIAELPDGGRADAIVVGVGPGSFTGVRVGIAAARALGLAWNVPVSGCSSLALVAAEMLASGQADSLLVVMEGGHGEVFIQPFSGRGVQETAPMQSLPYGAAADLAQGHPLIGNAVTRFGLDESAERHARAASLRFLPELLRQLPPSPVYGRVPDAKPMQ